MTQTGDPVVLYAYERRGCVAVVSWSQPASAQDLAAAEATDQELVAFVRQHYPRLIRLAGLICRDVTDSEDAVQVGLEHAWRARRSLREQDRLSSWLDRIVVREAIRQRRRGSVRSIGGVRVAADDVNETLASGYDLGESVTGREALRMAFDGLPAAQRAVVALHLYQGYSVPETAAMMGVPVETARSRLRIARERLRAALGEGAP